MKSLSILPMFLLLAACLLAQPQQAPQDRAPTVDNIVYLIDAYSEEKYGRLCESDEKLDSVFYDLIVGHDSPPDEFRRRVDSTFAQVMKSQPLLKADDNFSHFPRNYMPLSVNGAENYLFLEQAQFELDTFSYEAQGPYHDFYRQYAMVMELARAYSAIKFFYPYEPCSSNCMLNSLRGTIEHYLDSVAINERSFKLTPFETSYCAEEGSIDFYWNDLYSWRWDLVNHFVFKMAKSNIARVYLALNHAENWVSFNYLGESNETRFLSSNRYKLSARLSYDDSSFRVSFPDEPEISWPLEKIGSHKLHSLHQLIQSSCSNDKAAMLGNICHRLSYSAYSATAFTFRKHGETLKRELKNIPISREVEKMVLLRKKNRETPLQSGRNMFLRWLPDEPEALDSIFRVVYSGSPDTLFIETRSQYGSLKGVASCLASGSDTFAVRFGKNCARTENPMIKYGGIPVEWRVDMKAHSKHGKRKFVVCILVDSTTTGENEMYAMLLQSQRRCCVKGSRTSGSYGSRVYYNYGYPSKYLVFPSEGIMYPDGRKLVPGGLRIDVPYR